MACRLAVVVRQPVKYFRAGASPGVEKRNEAAAGIGLE